MTMPEPVQDSAKDTDNRGLNATEQEYLSKLTSQPEKEPAKGKDRKGKKAKDDKSPPKKPVRTRSSLGKMNGLSDKEKADLEKIDGVSPPPTRKPSSKEEPPSEKPVEDKGEPADVKKLQKKIDELKEKNEDLREKNRAISKEKTEVKNKLSKMTERFESKRKELEKFKKDAAIEKSNLAAQLKEARAEADGLRKAKDKPSSPADKDVKELESRLQAAKDDLDQAEADLKKIQSEDGKRIKALEERAEKAEEERDKALEDLTIAKNTIEGLKDTVSDLESKGGTVPSDAIASSGIVRRTSETTLESDLFTDGRYRMVLSRDGRSITFSADIEGKVVNIDGMVNIPRLPSLVPFDGIAEYTANSVDGKTYVMNL